jgi:hypothetical protein
MRSAGLELGDSFLLRVETSKERQNPRDRKKKPVRANATGLAARTTALFTPPLGL